MRPSESTARICRRSKLFGQGDARRLAGARGNSRWFRVLALISVVLASGAAFGDVTYVYDPGGRLVAAIDASGTRATYIYDNDGLLRTITNSSSSQTCVYAITPDHGSDGTQVTITGTGFSTTPSQNTVLFPGNYSARVISSTTTTIVAAVPSPAQNGTVSVTTPSGSANSYFHVP